MGSSSIHHQGPVTALRIANNRVIAGYGPILKVFSIKDDRVELTFERRVFQRNKIHAIAVRGKQLAIAGGRSFCVMDLENLQKVEEERAINEWITSIELYDSSTLLILNSHNTIYRISLPEHDLIEKVHCNEQSLLYSGSIRIAEGAVYVAAGTVMHGAIIWELFSRKIVCRLTDHEGSIFGVEIDPTAKFIATCSDDRSVKLYEFNGENTALMGTGWGHGSRIWKLAFEPESGRFVSFGEDCTARVWKYIGQSELLQEESMEYIHSGKSVWSGDVTKLWFVSGGADGMIRLHDITEQNEGHRYKIDNEQLKQFTRVGDTVVCLSSQGSLFSIKDAVISPISYENPSKLANFAIIRAVGDNSALIAARNGDVLVVDLVTRKTYWIEDTILQSSKVTNLLVSPTSKGHLALVDSPNPKVPFVVREIIENKSHKQLLLEQPQQTSFTTTQMAYDIENSWLLVASRYVTIAVYDLKDQTSETPVKLSAIFKKLSSGDTITSITVVKSSKNSTTLLLTVRDGVYMFVELTKGDTFEVRVIHSNKLARGFLEGGYLDDNRDLLLYGFKSSSFYVWNETKMTQVSSTTCGGSHKLWEFHPEAFELLFLEKLELVAKSLRNRFDDYGIINPGTHGREIRDVAVGPVRTLGPQTHTRLLLTASEDATVRLCEISASGIRGHWSMNNHVSGLQRVKFLSERYAASSAANEEFYVWEITWLDDVPMMKEVARLKPGSANPDLRIMDFAFVEVDNGFVICTVYSDSAIKMWHFDCKFNKFTLLASDYYKTCCILNVDILQMDGKSLLQTCTTDGRLTIWDVTKILTQDSQGVLGPRIISQQLHQNGIKAIVNIPVKDGFLIVTGGDDNALALSKLTMSKEIALETISFVADAASSTITSISSVGKGEFHVTSVDQIVRRWTYDGELVQLGNFYTTVADTGCSDEFEEDGRIYVVIGGAGLSMIESGRI